MQAAGEDDRGAELAEAAREGEGRAGGEAAEREGHGHSGEHAGRPGAERARRVEQVAVDGLEGGDPAADVERRLNERDGKDDGRLREGNSDPERVHRSSE